VNAILTQVRGTIEPGSLRLVYGCLAVEQHAKCNNNNNNDDDDNVYSDFVMAQPLQECIRFDECYQRQD